MTYQTSELSEPELHLVETGVDRCSCWEGGEVEVEGG